MEGLESRTFFFLLLYFAWPLAARVRGNLSVAPCDLCGDSPVAPPGDRLGLEASAAVKQVKAGLSVCGPCFPLRFSLLPGAQAF